MSKNKNTYASNKKSGSKKPVIIVLSVIVVLIGLLVVVNMMTKDNVYGKSMSQLNPATRELLDDPNYQNIMLPDELDQLKADKKNFFVYFFSSTCPHCKYTTPELTPVVNELDVDMKQFNTLEFPAYIRSEIIEYTPTLVYYENGVQVEKIVGGLAEPGTDGNKIEDYRAFFEKYKAKVNAPRKG
ncbi:thioredoxin family protein [Paenibacillus methanolicus]|uniref:Thiol-disulfide isomerase/thioredoxin n=1 Tax=Paenibacillus methanolicus TaxID=582686 RepID=A0A5S5C390_9BACL|nr:thioredoxin family protein [Paenibacillus methanolicus]TYP73777.1 thiol-disulfide isomerase/thioredoxin [Paenibacillus methanolicus]